MRFRGEPWTVNKKTWAGNTERLFSPAKYPGQRQTARHVFDGRSFYSTNWPNTIESIIRGVSVCPEVAITPQMFTDPHRSTPPLPVIQVTVLFDHADEWALLSIAPYSQRNALVSTNWWSREWESPIHQLKTTDLTAKSHNIHFTWMVWVSFWTFHSISVFRSLAYPPSKHSRPPPPPHLPPVGRRVRPRPLRAASAREQPTPVIRPRKHVGPHCRGKVFRYLLWHPDGTSRVWAAG